MAMNPNMLGARLGGLRQWVKGGGFADPGGLGQERPGPPTGFTNLEGWGGTALDALSEVPGGIGTISKAVRAGTKAANAYSMDDEIEAMGFEGGLSFGQQLGAAFGFNSFGTGGPKARQAAQQMAARDALAGGRGYTSQSVGPNARRGHRAGNQSGGGAGERGGRADNGRGGMSGTGGRDASGARE